MLHIRRPTLHDLNECAQLDSSYATQRVWQMSLRVEPVDIQVNFHLVQLPRPMNVEGTLLNDNLLQYWQRGDCLLTARQPDGIAGFLHMMSDPQTKSGLIHRHVVAPDQRRKGVGAALLNAALQWGRDHHLRSVWVQISTRNHPASAFYMAHSFTFTGFNEHFFGNQEITLVLARSIR